MHRSGTFPCPTTSAPASRSRATTTSSTSAIRPACTGRPSVRRSPRTPKLSLIDIGTPSRGPASVHPCSSSALLASARASSPRTSATLLVSGFTRPMRSRWAVTTSARRSAPAAIAACSSAMPTRQGSVTARSVRRPRPGRIQAGTTTVYRSRFPDRRRAAGVRSDAQENVQRLLRAARDAVGEEGPGVGVRSIAERAGLGVTTLYRHFPDKGALIDGVAVHRWSTLRALAECAVPPGGALPRIVVLLDTFTRMVSADDRLIAGAGWRVRHSPEALLVPAKAGYDVALAWLWARAQTQGAVHRPAPPAGRT